MVYNPPSGLDSHRFFTIVTLTVNFPEVNSQMRQATPCLHKVGILPQPHLWLLSLIQAGTPRSGRL